jgi:hypothetical protein
MDEDEVQQRLAGGPEEVQPAAAIGIKLGPGTGSSSHQDALKQAQAGMSLLARQNWVELQELEVASRSKYK